MSGELEAAGAMATAGLVAGAIEGREGGEAGEGACLNCGAALQGRFCCQCGQTAHPHRSLVHVLEEFMHGVIHFDTKAWRTLPMVIFRPGTLTRNYVFGKRARYISPLAMFLFTIFAMFFAFAFIETPPGLGGTPEEQRAEAVRELTEAREDLARAERELIEAEAAPAPTDGTPPGLAARLARQAVQLARDDVARRERTLETLNDVVAETIESEAAPAAQTQPGAEPQSQAPPATSLEVVGEAAPAETPAADAEEESNGVGWRPGETWQDGVARTARRGGFVAISGADELNKHINKKLENPDLALYKVQQTGYKFSFLLVPISLPFIALLFLWKRGVTFYDHVVYALYALSFASILLITIIAASHWSWASWVIGWLIGLGLPVHTFFHLKGAYALGWWSALWRTFFMLIFATIALSFFLVAIFLLGLGTG